MQAKSILGSKQDNIYSSQSSKKLINSSVKTPALLFYKPNNQQTPKGKQGQDQIRQNFQHQYLNKGNSLVHNNSIPQMGQIMCWNHRNLVAKYYSKVEDQQQTIYYCLRCAQLLRDQGFNITHISQPSHSNSRSRRTSLKPQSQQKNQHSNNVNNYPFPERQQQINLFMKALMTIKQEVQQKNGQVKQILISSQQFYGQQIEQINEYFHNIMQSLQLEKNKCYNHILLERQNAQKQTRALAKRFGDSERQINSMMIDIEENLDSVYSISWQNYKLVMETFDNRMLDIQNLLEQIKEKGIAQVQYRKIEFAGVPESINSLSQIIIQNSYGSVPQPDGSLLLTNNSNSSSFQNAQDQTIFQKLRTDHSQDSAVGVSNMHQNSNLMFSFDGERMREMNQQQNRDNFKQNSYPNQYIYEQSELPIKLRKNRLSQHQQKSVQRVEGIKQVQELDVVIMDQDLMSIPPGLKFAR